MSVRGGNAKISRLQLARHANYSKPGLTRAIAANNIVNESHVQPFLLLIAAMIDAQSQFTHLMDVVNRKDIVSPSHAQRLSHLHAVLAKRW